MWAPCLGSARERRHSTHVFTEPQHRRAAVLPEAQSRRASRGRRHPRGSRNRGITVPEFGRDLQDPHVPPLCPLLTALSATSPQLWNTSTFGDSPTTLRSCATAAPLFGDKILPNIQPEITESNPRLYPGPPKPYMRPSGPRAQGCAPRRPSAAEPFPKLCAKRTPARTWAGNTALLGPHSIPTSHPGWERTGGAMLGPRTSAHDARVLVMAAVVLPPAQVEAVGQARLVPVAPHVIQQHGPAAVPERTQDGGGDGGPAAQLPAHHLRVGEGPVVVAHRTPRPAVPHLHPTAAAPVAVRQPHAATCGWAPAQPLRESGRGV